ncbi:MAG: ABC transporter ATP-binding protein [Gemmatimonadales bacterium]
MSELLEVRNLTVTFETDRGLVRAVDGVSFDLSAGETLGLVGESGCGKTVTALSLLKLIQEPPGHVAPQSEIRFEDLNILDLRGENLRKIRGAKIAMIFQDPASSLNPVMTIGAQIAETIRAHESVSKAEARSRSIDLLARVGIPDPDDRFKSYAHQLSGGMLQRVMIAIALSCKPSILVADEPTTALDVTVQAQILELLGELQQEFDMSLILITHDLGVVAETADRVIVMYAGQVVEEAATTEIFSDPAHPYTQGLLDSMPRIDRPGTAISAIPGVVPPATNWPAGCRFHPRCSHFWNQCLEEPSLDALPANRSVRCWLYHDLQEDN